MFLQALREAPLREERSGGHNKPSAKMVDPHTTFASNAMSASFRMVTNPSDLRWGRGHRRRRFETRITNYESCESPREYRTTLMPVHFRLSSSDESSTR